MNCSEKRLLHQIYFLSEIVDDEHLLDATELYWVLLAKKADSRNWRGSDGRLKKLEERSEDWLQSYVNTERSVYKALSYLQAKALISMTKEGTIYRISVTCDGADVARKLDSFWGRADLLYKEYKDGVLWLLATVAVAMITALVTNLFER